jgi:hypothetical protein
MLCIWTWIWFRKTDVFFRCGAFLGSIWFLSTLCVSDFVNLRENPNPNAIPNLGFKIQTHIQIWAHESKPYPNISLQIQTKHPNPNLKALVLDPNWIRDLFHPYNMLLLNFPKQILKQMNIVQTKMK